MKSFVTGANGFIGRHLVKALVEKGDEVYAFVRRPDDCQFLKDLGVTLIQGDLTNAKSVYDAIVEVDVVYHLGATMKGKNVQEHFETTSQGTKYVIEAAKKAKVGKIVHASTLGVYDLSKCQNGQRINEDWKIDEKLEERGPYVHAKVKVEEYLLSKYRSENVPVTIIRPGLVYGPGGPVFFPHLGHKIGSRVMLVIGDGKNLIPFVYVENLVDAMIAAALEKSSVGKIYQIVDKEEITQNEYLKKLMKSTDWHPIKIHIPWIFLFIVAKSLEIAASLDPTGKVPKTSLHLWVSKSKHKGIYVTTRAKKDLGWSQKVNLVEGLEKTFQ